MSAFYTILSFTNTSHSRAALIEESSLFGFRDPIKKKGSSTQYMACSQILELKEITPGCNQYMGKGEVILYNYGRTSGFIEIDKWVFPTYYKIFIGLTDKRFFVGASCDFDCLAPNNKKIHVRVSMNSFSFEHQLWAAIHHLLVQKHTNKLPDNYEIDFKIIEKYTDK